MICFCKKSVISNKNKISNIYMHKDVCYNLSFETVTKMSEIERRRFALKSYNYKYIWHTIKYMSYIYISFPNVDAFYL